MHLFCVFVCLCDCGSWPARDCTCFVQATELHFFACSWWSGREFRKNLTPIKLYLFIKDLGSVSMRAHSRMATGATNELTGLQCNKQWALQA
jgi:hypothetical protein